MLVPVQHNEIQKICCGSEFNTVSVNEKNHLHLKALVWACLCWGQ